MSKGISRIIKLKDFWGTKKNNVVLKILREKLEVLDLPEELISTRKLRILPNVHQAELFELCLRGYRYTYNKALTYLKEHEEEANKISFFSLASKVMSEKSKLPPEEAWLDKIPYNTRRYAVQDLITARESGKTNKRKGNINYFKLGFKTCRDNRKIFKALSRVLRLNKKANIRIFHRRLKEHSKLEFKSSEDEAWLKDLIASDKLMDFTVLWENSKYFLCIPYSTQPKSNNELTDWVALDPGERTFLTPYSPEKKIKKFGEGFVKNILRRMFKKIDKLTSLISRKKKANMLSSLSGKKRKNKRKNIKKQLRKLRTKIRNKVHNLHHQTANILCKKFKVILLPEFGTKDMMSNDKDLRASTKNGLKALSHYKFRQILKHKAEQRGVQLIICEEAWTSKTCSRCGWINESLKGQEIFKCKSCGHKADRDENAARNILIKFFTENF